MLEKRGPPPLNLAKSQECGSTSLLLKLIPGTCFHIAPAWALNNVVSHGEKSPMCTYSMHVFVINTKNVYASLTCAVCMYHHVPLASIFFTSIKRQMNTANSHRNHLFNSLKFPCCYSLGKPAFLCFEGQLQFGYHC